MSAITANSFRAVVTQTSNANLTPVIVTTPVFTVGANMASTVGTRYTITNGANLPNFITYGLFGSRYSHRSLLSSYGLGELSGAFVLLSGIASNTIYLPPVGYDSVFTDHTGTTFITQCKYQGQASDYGDFRSPFDKLVGNGPFGDSAESIAPSDWSRFCQGATQLQIRATEVRLQFQATALARLLVAIWIVVRTVAACISSIIAIPVTTAFIIRTIMAHRNSREPAYHPHLAPVSISVVGGMVLAH